MLAAAAAAADTAGLSVKLYIIKYIYVLLKLLPKNKSDRANFFVVFCVS